MYFKNFPHIYYDFDINGKRELKILKDITKNVRIRKEILSNISVYDYYDIKDGETPEIIAEKVYGNSNYHWIIMLINERFNYTDDFPLSSHELESHITNKYGSGHEYDTHHYIDSKGFIVDEWNAEATSVSNYMYEEEVNESKRRIRLISKSLVDTILKNFSQL